MESKFHNTIRSQKVIEGANRLILSVILSVSTTPKTALATFPFLAALGHVTDKLSVLCEWDSELQKKVQQLGRIKNKKIRDPGLFQKFFDQTSQSFPTIPGQDSTKVQNYLARYYKLMLTDMTESVIPEHYWVNQVTKEEIKLAAQFFNKPDSDVAIITSDLVELAKSPQAQVEQSNFDIDQMTEPSVHMSQVESLRELEQFLEYSPAQQESFLQASVAAESVSWNELELAFFDQNMPKSHLFRVNTDCCLYFDIETNSFCQNPAMGNTSRCQIHQDTANSKFMKILATINQQPRAVGYSLAMSAFRFFLEPKQSNKVYEFAPCMEGALPAFKYSENHLRKMLIAGYKSYQAGYNTSRTKPFDDKFFREQFPNIKTVSKEQWMHAYLSLRVNITILIEKSYFFTQG